MNSYASQPNNTACHFRPKFTGRDRLTGFKITSAQPPSGDLTRLSTRLMEACLPLERFIDLRDRTKESYRDHTASRNQFGPEQIEGNYGIMPGDGLLFIDVDDWHALPEEGQNLLHENPTFTVSSPHAEGSEGHYLYVVDGPLDNQRLDWGEIRSEAWYIVGPGSEITECTHGCCTPGTPNEYTIRHDRPIATISPEELHTALLPEPNSGIDVCEQPTDAFTGDLDARIERGLETNADFRELWNWAREDGDPATVGYPDDRSGAETALSAHLNFWLSGDPDAIREAFDQVKPPKWRNRGESYRQSVLETGDNDVYYDPDTDGGGISWDAIFEVITALYFQCEGRARTDDIAAMDDVRIGRRQIVNVLNHLQEMGYVSQEQDEQDGRINYWIVEDQERLLEFAQSDELLEEYNPRSAALEWCRQNL